MSAFGKYKYIVGVFIDFNLIKSNMPFIEHCHIKKYDQRFDN